MKKLIASALIALMATAAPAFARQTIDFSPGWIFAKGAADSLGAPEKVALPHSWNAKDGTRKDCYRGTGTYTKRFRLDNLRPGKRVFLRFEAASIKAQAWLNGVNLGEHRGAFNAFCFEITDLLRPDANELTVVVDNSYDPDIAPLEGDFTMFGGLYRPASLIVTDADCITPMDMASPGVFVTVTPDGSDAARIDVEALTDSKASDLTLRTTIIAPDGSVAAQNVSNAAAEKHGFKALTDSFLTDSPEWWDGVRDPKLYTARVELLRDGSPVDEVTATFGCKKVDVDVRKGLTLNGKPYNIRGVNRHQDRRGMGWAITNKEHREDMALIKEIGANGIRLAHYPHSDYFYALCDSAGMLVWAEIPFIGRGTDSKEFLDNIELQLRELIRQNYNHPSIFCWSLFNELGGRDYEPVISHLHRVAHEEDPIRLTTAAPNNEGRAENEVTDLIAFNVYPGWYWAEPETMQYAVDWKYRPDKINPLGISEYGAGANIYQHAILEHAPSTTGQFHPEEWQAYCHEINYRELDKRPFLWGTFVWNMFDFASCGRDEGALPGMNDKGLVTYDRVHRKDAFYFYKANWNKREPMVHIASKRWDSRRGDTHDIKVYSNCDNVSLTVNGETLPEVEGKMATYVWPAVKLHPGKNTVTAVGKDKTGKTTVTDSFVLNIE